MSWPWPRVPHGADLARARSLYGEPALGWMDLSTGIHPRGWPAEACRVSEAAWRELPAPPRQVLDAFERYYGAGAWPVAGSQAVIQALPRVWRRLRGAAVVEVLAPSYGEHAARWSLEGHAVRLTAAQHLGRERADVMVMALPNNPTGERCSSIRLHQLAAACEWLVVDAAFADADDGDHGMRMPANAIVLRSLGKFFGLAGLRVGAVLAPEPWRAALIAELGPWAVSGPGLEVAAAALSDARWQHDARQWLAAQSRALGERLSRHGLAHQGTALFRTARLPQARALHEGLARAGIWTRLFELRDPEPYEAVRFGLPADERALQRLDLALGKVLEEMSK
ncbi:aminotransferase class I/II-fold pyridoxal phosphate-dependent enzyme [Schlegelella sp. S2-27]|uniref:Aminotransferase n=1 Tax=Caldimonas mangrovi TaxID=2944811 RepID=A0ABT0YUP3_9BURK|nr:aminotransferase class I/II-fold pyridoxal phosphate-dependent enzyme [Caldimonas mangrovi]MCM5681543.1 aminotransferase class I/II-fold pyridoxal phosphate-dependent enzyme [Caldimonas mangrovi]